MGQPLTNGQPQVIWSIVLLCYNYSLQETISRLTFVLKMYPATTKYTVSLLNPKDFLESDFELNISFKFYYFMSLLVCHG